MEKYAVIMAGGGGTRFWPLSRQRSPKQLLKITGEDVMINETIKRFADIIPEENTYIVTNSTQEDMIKEVLNEKVPRENVLVEPAGRNTAPCILYAALTLEKKYGEGVMCVFPADHHITQPEEFRKVLAEAIETAQETDRLVTIGIRPVYPSTGYGYIRFTEEPVRGNVHAVEEFVEKPGMDRAREYVSKSTYLWNSGMFVWKTSVILENFKRFLPRMYERMRKWEDNIDRPEADRLLLEIYPKLQNISIDYGIMERSNDVMVIPADFGWNDVGSWDSLGAIFKPDDEGNIVKSEFISIDTRNSIIYGDGRLIATIGLDEMIVVNTDDVLFVCPKSRAQEVKKVVQKLKETNRHEYL